MVTFTDAAIEDFAHVALSLAAAGCPWFQAETQRVLQVTIGVVTQSVLQLQRGMLGSVTVHMLQVLHGMINAETQFVLALHDIIGVLSLV